MSGACIDFQYYSCVVSSFVAHFVPHMRRTFGQPGQMRVVMPAATTATLSGGPSAGGGGGATQIIQSQQMQMPQIIKQGTRTHE